ncbi:nuclear transport factor 2 family protein [Terricaulis silvestris]|uniref:Putative ester cyclase n=1 Tax=Terricaulis silvestris TaxID=2686094 RepID=A0A6I6MQA2_9CAUL|nr:nuclear transport factor 2 family protein [Terricaulis silvestris]QGZ93712.1 putative ester cyclase [Terricaulis silvestris]
MNEPMNRRALVGAALTSPLIATAACAQPAATHDNEAIVRRAYQTAEGNVFDVPGFIALFADDAVINLGHAGIGPSAAGNDTFRGEHLGDILHLVARFLPDVHRVLHRVNVAGDTVAIELSIQGTFSRALETPAGIVPPTGARIDAPGADFWYLRDGKIERFDCYILVNTIYAQMGITPDFASAVARARG